MTTVYEIFKRGAQKFPTNKCFGSQVLNSEGKPEYTWLTYQEVDALVMKAAKFTQKYALPN